MPSVNPEILSWARKTAGLSLEEAAKNLKFNDTRTTTAVQKLESLEKGSLEPSRPILVNMARVYRRSLLVFYLSKPPRKSDRGQDFRTLPEDYSDADAALLDALIRNLLARQSMVHDLLEEEDVKPLGFVGCGKLEDGVNPILRKIEDILKINNIDLYKQSNAEKAFSLLRKKAEESGFYILLISNLGSYHTLLPLEVFRGFALADEIAPFIVINDNDSHAAWQFTLIHEITHILLGQTGISALGADKEIERFCNDVASEFLLPNVEIDKININQTTNIDDAVKIISDFSQQRNLSCSMVSYKLLRNKYIDRDMWKELNSIFRQNWQKSQEIKRVKRSASNGGPTYYITHRHRIGKPLVKLMDYMLASGLITTSKAGKILDVKAKNVGYLISSGQFS